MKKTCFSESQIINILKEGESGAMSVPVYAKRQALSKIKEFEELLVSWLKREARRRRK